MGSFPELRYHFGWIVAGLAALFGAVAGLGWWAGLGAGPGTDVPGREARALLMLGTFRSARHDPEGAASAFQRAFDLDPEGKSAAPLPLLALQRQSAVRLMK